MTLRNQFEKEIDEQGYIFPYDVKLYIKWLENKVEHKLPSLDDVIKATSLSSNTQIADKDVEIVYGVIKYLED